MIIAFKEKFKCKIGYSGHENTVSPTYAAWFLGADYIERHITLDRSMYGSDQSASIEPAGFKMLIGVVHIIGQAMGDGEKRDEGTPKDEWKYPKPNSSEEHQ